MAIYTALGTHHSHQYWLYVVANFEHVPVTKMCSIFLFTEIYVK